MSGRPYYQEDWFEYAFIAACFVVGYLLFKGLVPFNSVSTDTLQNLAMAKLFVDNRWLEAFSQFNLPPIFPLLIALVLKASHASNLQTEINSIQNLNLFLYGTSIVLVHYFVRRQIEKPYIFAITALYALAPPTLDILCSLDSMMVYIVASIGTLYAIDYSLSPDSHLGGWLSQRELQICGTLIGLSIMSNQIGYTLLIAFFGILYKRLGIQKSFSVLTTLVLCLSPFIGRDVFGALKSLDSYTAASRMFMAQVKRQGPIKAAEDYADRVVYAITRQAVGNLDLNALEKGSASAASSRSRIALAHITWGRWFLAVLAIIGAGYALYLYTGIGTIYLCVYALTALVFLPQFNLSLAPVLPLLLFSLYFGILKAGDWSRPMNIPAARILGTVLTGWILLCSFSEHLVHARGGFPGMIRRAQTSKIMFMNTAKKPENRLEAAQTEAAHRRVDKVLKDIEVGGGSSDSGNMLGKQSSSGSSDEIDLSDKGASDEGMVTLSGGSGKSASGKWSFGPAQADYLVEENSGQLTPINKDEMLPSRLKLIHEDVQGRIRIWQIRRQ